VVIINHLSSIIKVLVKNHYQRHGLLNFIISIVEC